MESNLSYEDAIKLLKRAVKHSHLDNQKHVDLSVAQAHEREKFEKALIIARASIVRGERTEEDFKRDLGLIS